MRRGIPVGLVAFALAIVFLPSAVGSEPESPELDADSSAAVEAVLADQMSAWSVDSGGGQSIGGAFALTAAIGQPDAGVLGQGGTTLAGGLWAGSPDLATIFSDDFEGGDTGAWSAAVGGIDEEER